jgi:hypothetical protein
MKKNSFFDFSQDSSNKRMVLMCLIIVLRGFYSLDWELMSNWVDTLDTEKRFDKVGGSR